ncbi:MAG: EI24 domain-containing protein [Phycisphaeraceae bacterium]
MAITRFLRGTRAPFDGFAYLRRHPSLWPFVLPAALVNVFITGAALLVLVLLAIVLINYVVPMFGDGFWQTVLMVLVIVAVVAVVVGLTVVCWLLMQNIISGHLLSKLAERVEHQLGLGEDAIRPVPFVRQVTDGVYDTALVLGIHGAAFAIQFVPVLGAAVGVPAALAADAYVFGSDFINHPLNLRGMSFKERRAFIRRHTAETVGVGAVTLPLGLIPVVGGLVMACSVIGAVRLYRELSERVDQPA